MRIYTRGGDAGETALMGGRRVSKADIRVEAYGTVDELNSTLGRARQTVVDSAVRERMAQIQHDLFTLGSVLATPPKAADAVSVPDLPADRVAEMESWIDEASDTVPPLREFILPGGSLGAADLHVARTTCRRAERRVTALAESEEVDELIVRYLNRLSDLLFVWARLDNHRAGVGDITWSKPG
jgi:cob(I)alamin adenosyltransferase